MDDRLLILEDTNGDGKADKCTTFAGDIHNPTGFELWNGGVLVAQGPDLLFLKDTDGDDKYDIKERLVHGFDTADTHHTINSFTLEPGGAVYMQEGTFHHSQIETSRGVLPCGAWPMAACSATIRARKRPTFTSPSDLPTPTDMSSDAWGQDIVVDGTGANPFHAPLFSSNLEYPNKHNRPPQVYQQRTRPCSAIEILSSSHFPEEHRGNLLVANVIGFQGILQYKLKDEGSSLSATEVEPIVFSSDPNFRPGDVEVGPDGAIYFTDWQNPIIGHMQHNLRDPSRDHDHGRVYRVRYDRTSDLDEAGCRADFTKLSTGELLAANYVGVTSKDDRARHRARIELSARPAKDVIAVTNHLSELTPLENLPRENTAVLETNSHWLLEYRCGCISPTTIISGNDCWNAC